MYRVPWVVSECASVVCHYKRLLFGKQREAQDYVTRRRQLEEQIRNEAAQVQDLEAHRVNLQAGYLQVGRTAMIEQGWRLTSSLAAAAAAEPGNEVTITTSDQLPPGCYYDWSESTLTFSFVIFVIILRLSAISF